MGVARSYLSHLFLCTLDWQKYRFQTISLLLWQMKSLVGGGRKRGVSGWWRQGEGSNPHQPFTPNDVYPQ